MGFLDPLSLFKTFLASLIFAEPIAFLVSDSLAFLSFLAAFFTAWWFA